MAAGQVRLRAGRLHHRPAVALHQLVHAAERGRVVRRGERRADAEPVNWRSRREQLGDAVLVEVAGADDLRLRAAAPVQDLPHRGRHLDEVAGVEPHRLGHDPGDVGGLAGGPGAGEGVVRVDQERRSVGVVAHEGAERLDVGREREHVAVRHRARRRDAPQVAGSDGGGGGAAADIGRAGREQARVGAVRAAEPEVDHRPPARGADDPGRLRGDHGLKVHLVQQERLGQLAGQAAALDAQQRLAGVDDRPLGHRVDAALEPQRRQMAQQRVADGARAAQVVHRLRTEPEARQVLAGPLEAGRDQEPPVGRHGPHEELEGDHAVGLALGQVGVGHRQLVLVGHELDGRPDDHPAVHSHAVPVLEFAANVAPYNC